MSEKELQQVGEELKFSVSKFIKVLWVAGGLMFAVGGWTATQQVLLTMNSKEDRKAQTRIDSNATKLASLEVWQARTDASQYTLKDQSQFEKQLAQDRLLQEKRLQRLEDTQQRIAETQVETQKLLKSLDQQIRTLDEKL